MVAKNVFLNSLGSSAWRVRVGSAALERDTPSKLIGKTCKEFARVRYVYDAEETRDAKDSSAVFNT